MRILTNEQLNSHLHHFGVYIDSLQNINFSHNYNYPVQSLLNQEHNAVALLAISQNLIGWMLEIHNISSIFFKLSLLSSFLPENKFIWAKLLTPPREQTFDNLSIKINSDAIYMDAYEFNLSNQKKTEVIFENIILMDLINYILSQEEHGSLIAVSPHEFRLISLQDGLVSIASNKPSCINNEIITQLLDAEDVQYRTWIIDE